MDDPSWKIFTVWDAVSVRLPAHWSLHVQPKGHFGCYHEDEAGTVWIDWTGLDEPDSDFSGRPFKAMDEPMHMEYQSEEDGRGLRHSAWHHMALVKGVGLHTVHLTAVVPEQDLERAEMTQLLADVEHELAHATIDWRRLLDGPGG